MAALICGAVLTGALVVGDSVRGSLRQTALERLGGVVAAMDTTERFLSRDVAARLSSLSNSTAKSVTAALHVNGAISRQDGTARAGRVEVYGAESLLGEGAPLLPAEHLALNEALATQLRAKPGDEFLLRFPKPSALSRDVPVTPQSDAIITLRLKFHAVIPASHKGNFSLRTSQLPPLNVFVREDELEKALGAETVRKANLFLANAPAIVHEDYSVEMARKLNSALPACLAWEDYGLLLERHPSLPLVELKTSRIFLEPAVAQAAMQPMQIFCPPVSGQPELGLSITNQTGVLTYLANLLRHEDKTTPYSMVAAVDSSMIPSDMREDEILINQWLAEDLAAAPGAEIELTWFLPESSGRLVERTNRFRVRKIVPMELPWADRRLMPEFPGIAKAESTHDWDAGFPLVHKIRPKDDQYWKQYRGTPKAFITLAAGQRLWANRFGSLTAIRFPYPEASVAGEARAQTVTNWFPDCLKKTILSKLAPEQFGWRFEPALQQALSSVQQAQDFAGLFIGFSFFLVASALILLGLMFQLSVEKRSWEAGTLLAMGFTPGRIQALFLSEAAALAFIGGLFGALGGAGYGWLMLRGLTTIWRDAIGTSVLNIHVHPITLLTGLLLTVAVCVITAALTLRSLAHKPVRELLSADTTSSAASVNREKGRFKRPLFGAWRICALSAAMALTLLCGNLILTEDLQPGVFFGAGALLLVAGLAAASAWLRSLESHKAVTVTLAALSIRSCARRRHRSLAVAAMLACGCFLVVAIGVFRLDAGRETFKRSSGTGGFALIGQSNMPVLRDLNTTDGIEFYGLDARQLNGVSFVPLRVKDGDEASCLNLTRAQLPRLLGVNPDLLQQRGAFTFAKMPKKAPRTIGWSLLRAEVARQFMPELGADEIPAIGDAASIQWALGKKIGDTIEYTDEQGRKFKLRLVGAVANSILQGNLLINETEFTRRFPSISGHRMWLIDAPVEKIDMVSAALSRALQQAGFEIIPAARRLAEFNAVQNTYLGTFQLLGGLGLLLGSFGLGAVVLRNLLERRPELALMLAVGFLPSTLQWLALAEHGALLAAGLILGTGAALVAVLPALMTPGGIIPYLSLGLTLAAVLLNGLLWTWAAARVSFRGNLLAALRNE